MFTGSQPVTPTFFLSQCARVMRYIVHSIRGTLSKNTPRGAERLCRGAPKRKSISVHVSTSGGDEIKPRYNPRTTAYECGMSARMQLEARGGERKLAGLPVVCCWCCCCWCCCCRCCAGRCCAGCSAGAGSSASAAAGAGWSAAAAAAAALGMLLLLLLPLLRWALQMLGVLQLLGGPAHRAQGGVEPRGGGSIRLI